MRLEHGAASDVGHVREVNEDAWLATPSVFVVADGMGGHQGGDVASALVVEEFQQLDLAPGAPAEQVAEVLVGAMAAAHQRINDFAATRRLQGHEGFHAGTTSVAAVLVDDDGAPAWLVANIGDSRAYGFSADGLFQVTVDHSLVQEMLQAGAIEPEEVATHPERNVVTRALGGNGVAEPDFFLVALADAPRLLLCTDGVSGLLDASDMSDLMAEHEDADDAARALVAAALEAGGHDNATALVVEAR